MSTKPADRIGDDPVSKFIVGPQDIRACDRQVVGGKGASLGRLAQRGFAVPTFFTISTDAYSIFEENDFSEEFVQVLRQAYDGLGGESIEVAVRSSGVAEDAAGGSSAGIYTTRLGARGLAEVLEGVRECWKSLGTAAAAQYRTDRSQASDGGMAVVVQELIRGEWSGVTFTANPVSMALTEMVINAVPGMGEALVAGEVNPDELILGLDDGAPIERKTLAGAVEASTTMIHQVWAACKSIAEAFEFPQDIEWTYRDGKLWLLQARPITTIAPIYFNRYIEPWRAEPAVAEDPEVMWTRAYGDEVWTSPESPLNYSVRNPPGASAGWFGAYLPAHGDDRPLPPACAKTFQSAAYANVDVLRRIYEYHPKFARIAGVVNFFPRSMQDEIKNMPWRWQGRIKRHWKLERKDRPKSSIAHNHRYIETLSDPLIKVSDAWFDQDLDTLSLEELRSHLASEVMPQVALTGTYYAIGVMYHSFDLTFILTGLLERWFGDGDALYATVSSGLPNSATVAEAQSIWQLAKLAGTDAEVSESVKSMSWEELRAHSREDQRLQPFAASFGEFWESHRHRGAAYKDIMFARWGDDPNLLLELVRSSMGAPGDSPAQKNADQAQQRIRQQQTLLNRCRFRPARWQILRWLFKYNEIYMAIRNDHRFYFDRLWYERRRVYLSMGERLVKAGVLTRRDDVFFIGTNEIDAALRDQLAKDELDRRIETRRSEWEQTLLAQAPKFLRGYTPFSDEPADEGMGADHFEGIAASPGTATGPARVIFRIEQLSSVQPGDVLITRQTDPGWTPVFSRISALVLETGGVLAHGTSLCREYGLPCVTVVERATNRIPDGARVQVDGSRGRVTVLAGPESDT